MDEANSMTTLQTMDDIRRELTRIGEAEDKLAEERDGVIDEVVAKHCPWKVGEETEVPRQRWGGPSYAGMRCIITQVTLRNTHAGDWKWKVTADVLNKDGRVGKRAAHWMVKI